MLNSLNTTSGLLLIQPHQIVRRSSAISGTTLLMHTRVDMGSLTHILGDWKLILADGDVHLARPVVYNSMPPHLIKKLTEALV
ncbi:MAG: hypothetical protein J07HQW2_02519 [Haloquadratum walsbyi J07HQW2]|uniref:Uncharacterized protein n=1 Tax=Haloquadratum walsbyi J07HQW2 TaxID=1238425 RepID=U1PQK7_9EURY|nr:MAG: hypothetical protein J07HQW2_02519 [Haloquadratum walsbyi J07HQW2]